MKNLKILTLISLLGATVYLALSCSNSTGPDHRYDFPDPIDSVETISIKKHVSGCKNYSRYHRDGHRG